LPTAEAIMAQVAAHQDQGEAERAHYVYVQHAKVDSRRGRTTMCEEITDYRVTPMENGTHQELLKLDGRLWLKGKYVTYNALSATAGKVQDGETMDVEIGGDEADRDMVENMRKNLLLNSSKDGINAQLFPLTSKEQESESFRLMGRERLNGRDVFHVAFRPKDKSDWGWKGDAFVDTATLEPVMISTEMARKVPLAVRTLLGTNVPGLGFTVIYAAQPDGVWFPVSFSTEFKIHVLFFFRREIVIDAENRSFEKTHVTTRILGADGREEQLWRAGSTWNPMTTKAL